jgi:predicted Zn-dependent peptidase
MGSSLQRAVLLSQYAIYYDDPERINTRADKIAKVTAADVQRVAQKYLVKTGRTVVLTVPKSAPTTGGER